MEILINRHHQNLCLVAIPLAHLALLALLELQQEVLMEILINRHHQNLCLVATQLVAILLAHLV